MDLLLPDVSKQVERKQKEEHDRHAVGRQLKPGDTVYVQTFGQEPTWLLGQELSPVSYKVTLDEKAACMETSFGSHKKASRLTTT